MLTRQSANIPVNMDIAAACASERCFTVMTSDAVDTCLQTRFPHGTGRSSGSGKTLAKLTPILRPNMSWMLYQHDP